MQITTQLTMLNGASVPPLCSACESKKC